MDRDWLVRIGLRGAMQKGFSLSLVLGLVACGGETPIASDYGEIVRAGYFEADIDSGDWRGSG